MYSVKQIKLMNELIRTGISKQGISELYDVLHADVAAQSQPSPPNSQPLPDCVNNDHSSPPSSQNYSMALALSADLDTPRPTNIESPPYTDEEPWPQWPANTINSEKKRDRFVFKHVHHDILNEAFLRNRYPENDEKECLVEKCNAALENYKNRPLKESEKMTILNITNWFNNRRKEKKRNRRTLDPSSYCVQNLKENNEVKEEIISEDDV